MKTEDFEKYLEKKIRVKFVDGQELVGELDSVVPDYDTESGKDEIELFVGGQKPYVLAPVDEVDSVEILE